MSVALNVLFSLLLATHLCFVTSSSANYQPDWDSLDSRPNPAWYDEAKFGIFMHWGLFSVPAFRSEWFWWYWKGQHDPDCVQFMEENYPPGFSYADFAPMFKAEYFNPDTWADLLAKSGARYLVLTSKHHEGWTNWRSNVSWNWNSVDAGPHRDLVGDLAAAIRNRTNITFGLYYSLFEWFHPLYLQDKKNHYKTSTYVDEIMIPQLHDIVNKYKPDYIWSDGAWDTKDTYWKSKEFLAWLFNESPVKDTVVVNDRWGAGDMCKHGGVYTCSDRYNPGVLQNHKWEDCMTIDKKSWGYRKNTAISDYLTMEELTTILASVVSCGGNLLMNVGPSADGTIAPVFQERLLQMGEWLNVNGESIYSTKPWKYQNDSLTPDVWYTSRPDKESTYAIVLDWPKTDTLTLGRPVPNNTTAITLLGMDMKFPWKRLPSETGIEISIPYIPESQLPCQWAWVFKMTNLN